MMEPHIVAMLKKEEHPENVSELRDHLRTQLRHSRGKMKDHYATWDRHLRVFKGLRAVDEEDINAIQNDEPAKMVVPMQYTQVMTFVTFAYLLYKQNPSFFMMQTRKNSDYQLVETCESFLDRDLRHNKWNTQIIQYLLDAARMGVCASKCVWKQEWMKIKMDRPAPSPLMMGPLTIVDNQPATTYEDVLKFEGNNVIPVSPYRLLPDMRFPLTRWREGRFVADEYEYHIQYLKELEARGDLAGCEHIERMESKSFKEGGWAESRFPLVESGWASGGTRQDETDFMCIVTEGQFKINPKKYKLGEEDYDCDFIVAMANDNRVIRIERCEYVHGEFIYDLAQFLPDVHNKLNHALTDTIDALQDVITWLINARMVSVRRGLETHAVVDPSVVDVAGMEGRQPIYCLRKGAPRVGVEKFFMQLKYVDPTTRHFDDADVLMRVMQTVTGVNENAMGQYAPGRRSASENKAANAGAASRMMLHASILWEDMFTPLGRKMLSNQRQGVSIETFKKVIGDVPATPGTGTIDDLYARFCPRLSQLVGSEDFFVFDGTTQSERTYVAQSLQELVIAIFSNPEVMPLLNFDINKLIDEIQFYRGIRNLNRFKLGAGAPPQSVIPAPVPGGPPGAAPAAGGLPADLALQALSQ